MSELFSIHNFSWKNCKKEKKENKYQKLFEYLSEVEFFIFSLNIWFHSCELSNMLQTENFSSFFFLLVLSALTFLSFYIFHFIFSSAISSNYTDIPQQCLFLLFEPSAEEFEIFPQLYLRLH